MRATLVLLFLLATAVLATALVSPPTTYSPGVENAIGLYKAGAPIFAQDCAALQSAIKALDPRDKQSILNARQKLIACRSTYKSIESFIEYFFRTSTRIYNRAPKFEAEEPFMEYQSPVGLQVIESLLYEKITSDSKQQLQQQAEVVASSASDLVALLYGLKANDRQLLESLRIELVRIITLDITGYEAPFLKTGIAESYEALLSISHQLQPYLITGETASDSLQYFLQKSLAMLEAHPAFDSFDRIQFLRSAILPLQNQLSRFIRTRGLFLNTNTVLNYDAKDLFSPDALMPGSFSQPNTSNPNTAPASSGNTNASPSSIDQENNLIARGKTLFYQKSLSGNGNRNCASCHDPNKYFTDAQTTSLAIDGHSRLPRNAPTLLYCGMQYQQFWDGRVASLEEQIKTVLQNPQEMAATDSTVQHIDAIAKAIAAYVRSLHPMNAPFDQYLEANGPALSSRAIHGANLFMGKAQCATCHFIPLFNGLIPPDYARTEYEVLGTTQTDQLNKPHLSKDSGRFSVYPFDFYQGAFKTPTVRNTAKTGPYMHNGAFHTLEKVMDFYNKGGGAGLGLNVPSQTLSTHPLELSKTEEQDIILFLNTLTDDLSLTASSQPVGGQH